ncbi:MAG: hypothetical protein GIKADHBN_01184 [Phycisphaerales bacterium]|nr:hypothetical protein [Phycisphaerales bacterium]
MKTQLLASVSVACALVVAVGSLIAGPLDPPAGPAASTYKTLTDVEPRILVSQANTPGDNDATPAIFKITKPGSYYLGGDVTGVAGRIGIEIDAPDVTLDLNGFTCKGVEGSLTGIRVNQSRAVIRNGRVGFWGQGGIKFVGGQAYSSEVRNVRAMFNTGIGIELTSYSSAIDCVAEYNTATGIRLYAIGTAINCTAMHNGTTVDDAGFAVDNSQNQLINCRSSSNTGSGYSANSWNSFEGCMAASNGASGFEVGNCQLTRCTTNNNTGYGFNALSGGVKIDSCQAANNGLSGFTLGTGCIVTDSLASGHASASQAGFYVAGNGSRITGSHAYNNARGFFAGSNLNAFLAMNSASANTTAQFVINAGNDNGAVITNPGTGFSSTNPFANVAP